MAELGLLSDNFKQLDNLTKTASAKLNVASPGKKSKLKTQSMHKLRKTHKHLKQVHKRLMKRKGGFNMEVFAAIGEFFMAIINAIIKLVELIIGAVNQAAQREEERRKAEQEQAEKEQREKELNEMLFDYNNQLKDLCEKANMNARDYILLNLKDDNSRVSDMKRTILNKASDFKMTQREFVDYCLQIAGSNSWWYVAELLKVMKAEFDNPGLIANAKVKAPPTYQPVLEPDEDYDSFDDDDDEPIYANASTIVKKTDTLNNLKKDIGKILPVKKPK